MAELPVISLFSGAGGLDLGVEAAGYRVRVAVELDRDACQTLRANSASSTDGAEFFDGLTVLERDIRTLSTGEILEAADLRPGEAELLVGGPPCTPFSKSGYWLEEKRSGLDPDATLLDHYVRVLADARPRGFILENVFGLAYRNHNAPRFKELIGALQALGYNVVPDVLLAADFGVPQRRQRLLIRGSLDGRPGKLAATHSGPHETKRVWDTSLLPHVTAGEAIGDLADREDLREPEEEVNGKYGHLLPEIPSGDNYLFFTEKRNHPKPVFEWRKRYWSFLLKLDPEQPSPTIQAQPGPYVGPFHWRNRRLRLAEIKRLQSFPDEYLIHGSRRSAQVQIGNAVPPLLAERVAASLRHLGADSLTSAHAETG